MKRELLSLALCLCLILTLIPAGVFAEGEAPIYYKEVIWDDADGWSTDSEVRLLTSRPYYTEISFSLQFVTSEGVALTLAESDITVSDTSVCTVEAMRGIDGCFEIRGLSEGEATISFTAEGTAYASTIEIEVWNNDPSGQDDPHGDQQDDRCHSATFKIGEDNAAVGFGFVRSDGVLDLYVEGNSGPSCLYREAVNGSYGADEIDQFDYPICVAKIVKNEGDNTIYQDITDTVELNIKEVHLEAAYTTAAAIAFSLEKGSVQVMSKASPQNPPEIYYNCSYEGKVKVCATVEVDGTEYEIWYTVTTEFDETQVVDFSKMNSIREINEALAQMKKSDKPVEIVLGPKTYGGPGDDPAIIIPDLTSYRGPDAITIRGTIENNDWTGVLGGIELRSPQGMQLEMILFTAREAGKGTGAVGTSDAGPCNVSSCTFSDFDVAIDSTNSFIGAYWGNSFFNNKVALKVALQREDSNQDQLERNRFEGNGTAVQVTKLNNFVTPYYFRLRDGEFINNGVDFDISQEGEYYFYRNLFATDGETLREPVIEAHDGVIIHCYPAKDFDGNLILSKKDSNTILNAIAGQLQILVSQLAGQKMTIVSDEGSGASIIGYIEDITASQSSGGSSSRGGLRMAATSSDSEELFTPSLDVTRSDTEISVTLQDVPSGLKLAVSIPDIAWENITVKHGGEELEEVTLENGLATFSVTEGGEYIIAEKTEDTTPDEPVTPPRGGGGGSSTPKEEEPAAESPAEPEPSDEGHFKDVDPDDYFYEAVEWAAEQGITSGVSKDEFGPSLGCTRAQVVTFLWIASGSPDAGSETGFDDVDPDAYYDKAVAWAVEQGITAGTGEDAFSPDVTVTRAQFITMLWVSQGKPEAEDSIPFLDVPADSYYAKAVAWAYANGITAGKSATEFGSDDPCTRGQIAVFLHQTFAE